jgi:hypothetical protein
MIVELPRAQRCHKLKITTDIAPEKQILRLRFRNFVAQCFAARPDDRITGVRNIHMNRGRGGPLLAPLPTLHGITDHRQKVSYRSEGYRCLEKSGATEFHRASVFAFPELFLCETIVINCARPETGAEFGLRDDETHPKITISFQKPHKLRVSGRADLKQPVNESSFNFVIKTF